MVRNVRCRTTWSYCSRKYWYRKVKNVIFRMNIHEHQRKISVITFGLVHNLLTVAIDLSGCCTGFLEILIGLERHDLVSLFYHIDALIHACQAIFNLFKSVTLKHFVDTHLILTLRYIYWSQKGLILNLALSLICSMWNINILVLDFIVSWPTQNRGLLAIIKYRFSLKIIFIHRLYIMPFINVCTELPAEKIFPLWQCSNPIDKTPIGG